ncbi:MAG TPA: NAD-dependent epimerase/dehydratase family protein [Candidatus Brocadiaceae bacterium]|nr:NAD-dependent epimerase/dehydratase family protein [Candidatus Woesearchaeota archaeon]
MRVLVTGANGFVGSSLCKTLSGRGYFVRAAVRSMEKSFSPADAMECIQVGEIGPNTDWAVALRGIDVVAHLASRVHIMRDASTNPSDDYRRVNIEGTRTLAEAAVKAGVSRCIFLSTIKVSGEQTTDRAFVETDISPKMDPYSISKNEAELALNSIADKLGLEVVIIRPPLVYGPGVKANFLRLIDMVNKNIPLPLSLVRNKRSMIYVGNLTDAIIKCIEHKSAANKTFLISDGQDISTSELIKMIAKAMGKKPSLLPLPPSLIKALGKLAGKSLEVDRLVGSLRVDSTKIRKMLGWKPPFTIEEGISETVRWYMDMNKDATKRG